MANGAPNAQFDAAAPFMEDCFSWDKIEYLMNSAGQRLRAPFCHNPLHPGTPLGPTLTR